MSLLHASVSKLIGITLALAALLAQLPATAAIAVERTVVPIVGGFHYEFSVEETALDGVILVSLVDAPLGDPLIAGSLTGPAGFLTNYDGGLGIVDFIADTVPEFPVGTTGPFAFDSLAAPDVWFSVFEAFDTSGNVTRGLVNGTQPIPLPGSLALVAIALAIGATGLRAASHSDAPLIKQDPQANITDVYSFVGTRYNDPSAKVLNVIVHVRPFSEPGDGVIYDRFADDALYSIHIAHPTTGAEVLRYNFQFSAANAVVTPGLKNPNTILSYGLGSELGPLLSAASPRRNYTQTYSVTKVAAGVATPLGSGLLTPPPNVGQRTTPHYNDSSTGFAISGATTFAELDLYTRETVIPLSGGEVVFAGPRDDGFYADVPGIFDLLDARILDNNGTLADGLGQDGGGVDGFKGFNVLAFAIQIPIASLPQFTYSAPFANLSNPLPAIGTSVGVGVYASVSRQRLTLRRSDGDPVPSGPWVQVSRMGNPLFNEVFVASRDKDKYNRLPPTADSATFAGYALNPELALLLNAVYSLQLAAGGRSDLAALFVPDVLRVDTSTPAVRLAGQTGFSRLGFIGGDTTTGSGGIKSSGWPNGRRLGDDVVDIALTALVSGPSYSTVVVVGDNVAANDQVFNKVFPYAATPHAGTRNRKD